MPMPSLGCLLSPLFCRLASHWLHEAALNPQRLCTIICLADGNDFLSRRFQQGLVPAPCLNSVLSVGPSTLTEL